MSVKIGISPIAWQNDDLPELTADYTMDQALEEAREIGFTGVERGRRMPQETEALRAYLGRYDLALCGVYPANASSTTPGFFGFLPSAANQAQGLAQSYYGFAYPNGTLTHFALGGARSSLWFYEAQPTISLRGNWAGFLMAQLVFGLGWSGAFAGAEWAAGHTQTTWGWPLAAALAFIAIGPAVVAYRCWGVGVQRAGPAVAGFFANLTPLFAALMSAAFLGDTPRLYHGAAFGLIVGGIVVSSRR